jgi:hypothetical protein
MFRVLSDEYDCLAGRDVLTDEDFGKIEKFD